jgi:hypothetical protein
MTMFFHSFDLFLSIHLFYELNKFDVYKRHTIEK